MNDSTVTDIDHGWKEITRELGRMDRSYVKIGILGDAKGYKSGESIQEVALTQEFGDRSRRIPARPFMTQAFQKNRDKINDFIRKKTFEILGLKNKTDKALKEIGSFHQAQVKDIFVSGDFAALSPVTIEIRRQKLKSGKAANNRFGDIERPLIDTGHLRNSIKYEVVD